MASKVTVKDLHNEIDQIKNNHLAHMAKDIDALQEAVKDNRTFFQGRLDRLDNRIYMIMGGVGTTLVTLLAALIGGMM
tara:strand:+ start:452 stop:685 length:234 start_codon:yes stop_codon:yes gene_type:complete